MTKNSREKGKKGERELAQILRGYGYEARRGVQYNGSDGSADVVGLPGIHIECKRVERLYLYKALEQAIHDAPAGTTPVVMHRSNNEAWVVIQPLDAWLRMYAQTQQLDSVVQNGKCADCTHRVRWEEPELWDDTQYAVHEVCNLGHVIAKQTCRDYEEAL